MKKKIFTRTALILSVCLLIAWALLGTGATIAWFTDTTPVAKNTFLIGELDLLVSYKNDLVTQYAPVDSQTAVFNEEALYEPGYTQVVYLKIENTGDMDFDYKLSVDIRSYVDSLSVHGTTLHLPDYLKFGVIFGDSEAALDRELARYYADRQLYTLEENRYSQPDVTVAPGGARYAALIVYMPEEIDNAANYRGVQPQVQLGITVFAQQAGTPME